MQKRMIRVFDDAPLLTNAEWRETFAVWKRAGSFAATCTMKTNLAAWCTSKRMHEAIVLPCIYGCKNKQDDIFHYVDCPTLWMIVQDNFPGNAHGWNGSAFVTGSLPRRLAIHRPSTSQV